VYQDVPIDYYTLPIGKAALIRRKGGYYNCIWSSGAWALNTLSNNSEISADLLDLRTLQPLILKLSLLP
jgi:2-oxoisovalerate dehydrogenase E1 component